MFSRVFNDEIGCRASISVSRATWEHEISCAPESFIHCSDSLKSKLVVVTSRKPLLCINTLRKRLPRCALSLSQFESTLSAVLSCFNDSFVSLYWIYMLTRLVIITGERYKGIEWSRNRVEKNAIVKIYRGGGGRMRTIGWQPTGWYWLLDFPISSDCGIFNLLTKYYIDLVFLKFFYKIFI